MKTIRQRFVEVLTARGEIEVLPSPSRKYRCFTRSLGGYYWLGRSGALRVGDCASRSVALGEVAKTNILTGTKY